MKEQVNHNNTMRMMCVCVCVILVGHRMCETCKGANTKLFWSKVILAPAGVTFDTFDFFTYLILLDTEHILINAFLV